MSFLRIYKFSRSSYLLALILIFPLISCSGGDGGDVGDGPGPATVTTFGELNLSWIAPDQREDGTEFFPSLELAEYRIYYGSEPGDYQNQVDVIDGFTDAQVASIPAGLYYAVVTAVDKQGRESLYSEEVKVAVAL
jgi:hypothetical protein